MSDQPLSLEEMLADCEASKAQLAKDRTDNDTAHAALDAASKSAQAAADKAKASFDDLQAKVKAFEAALDAFAAV